MARAALIVLDSVGIGGAPDAARFGDQGADTLGHIYARVPGLALPALDSLGLGRALLRDPQPDGLRPGSRYGWMSERSAGKDTTIGHWEIAGAVTEEPLATFQSFPEELVRAIEREAGVRFIGNYPQSGTVILDELGARHMASGRPILYTSADSVLQIAAHEDVMPVEELYALCRIARRHADRLRIGRVIARPFTGTEGAFERTANRHDFSLCPPPTVLDRLKAAGVRVVGVGKISDIFAGSGITESHPTTSNSDGTARIAGLWPDLDGLLFANLVDFDSLFGHRRNPEGYADCLREFDAWLEGFLCGVGGSDLLIITADHGNDPTWTGTDHTREQVPLLTLRGDAPPSCSGGHDAFTVVAALVERFFLTPDP